MKTLKTFGAMLLGAQFLFAGKGQAMTITYSGLGQYVYSAVCNGPTPGGTELKSIEHVPGGADFDFMIDALAWQFSGANIYSKDGIGYRPPEDQWTFDWGSPLAGTLSIDNYVAFDTHDGSDCIHGAQLSASYFAGAGDPKLLDWVQVFVASYDKNGVSAGTPLADPFYNDGTDDGPFYFSNLDVRSEFFHGAPPPNATAIFGDTPHVSHEETSRFSADLTLFLVLASPDPMDSHHVILHDGITWGYVAHCPDGTSTLPLVAVALIVILRCGASRSRREL